MLSCFVCGNERPKENGKFCSMACRDKKEKPSREYTCVVCDAKFLAKVPFAKYCSVRCRGYGAKLDARGFLRHLLKHRKRHLTISLEEICEMYVRQNGICAISGIPMTHSTGLGRCYTNISIDRLDPGGPYVIENVRLVCLAVNLMRLDMKDEELLSWCRSINSNMLNIQLRKLS